MRHRRPHSFALLVLLSIGWPAAAAQAQDDACARASLRDAPCAALPVADAARRRTLARLDRQARDAVAAAQLALAAERFVCLLRADPRPETALNLSLVRAAAGERDGARDAAACAESLAPSGPVRERARAQVLALGPAPAAPTEVPAPETGQPSANAAPILVQTLPPEPSARGHSPLVWAGAATAVAAVVAAGVLYGLAQERATAFGDEQRATGYSDRARELRAQARGFSTASLVSAVTGVALGTATLLWVRF